MKSAVEELLAVHKGFRLQVTGHSLGKPGFIASFQINYMYSYDHGVVAVYNSCHIYPLTKLIHFANVLEVALFIYLLKM